MTQVHCIETNPFGENTYIVYDETGECVIFDPGCYTQEERDQLKAFIEEHQLTPVRLINTHCHLDHIFGNAFVANTWQLGLEIHRGEVSVLARFPDVCKMYGVPNIQLSPEASAFIEPGDIVAFGNTSLKTLFTPGHSPASLSFYCEASEFVIAGDVLFFESIGRTDLPGGHMETLLASIRSELFTLPGATVVYSGHGPTTTIRHEMESNPFL